ncbi:TetR family transcriptional regulator BpeR [Massilia terrae]|uniref:TetR family transcriptional regulator n=1 Tax=Massilia terrae TaxID=1811224 RepID=A0ABT2CVR0_9BURK|nr:TetR family transcriptional regulator [Massilia terrae]MCS0658068.1 TetR family transcriptional regulator [Massilia terrae]
MARRTKEEAAATRDRILDAAEQLFAEHGVSRTTLQHIATAAGVTRGAIYWHFDDKVALFNAMIERVVMPLEMALGEMDGSDPLRDLREHMMAGLRVTVEDERARRVFEIASLKMEIVGELDAARLRRHDSMQSWKARFEERIKRAIALGTVRADVNPRAAALGMWSLEEGLIRNWLFDPASFDLLEVGAQAIDAQISGLRA